MCCATPSNSDWELNVSISQGYLLHVPGTRVEQLFVSGVCLRRDLNFNLLWIFVSLALKIKSKVLFKFEGGWAIERLVGLNSIHNDFVANNLDRSANSVHPVDRLEILEFRWVFYQNHQILVLIFGTHQYPKDNYMRCAPNLKKSGLWWSVLHHCAFFIMTLCSKKSDGGFQH